MRVALIGMWCVFLPSGLFAQRPAPDTLPASGGSITILPIRHGTVGIIHDRHVIPQP